MHHGYRQVFLLVLDLVASEGDGVGQVQTGHGYSLLVITLWELGGEEGKGGRKEEEG